jgi:uncharacterized protein
MRKKGLSISSGPFHLKGAPYMLGMSIYLSEPVETKKSYIEKMKNAGFTSIFTSLHIPEDNPEVYRERLIKLGSYAKEYGLELMADISSKSLSYLGYQWEEASELLNWGLTGLRIDYGIENQTIVELSKKMKVALNASTLTQEILNKLVESGLESSSVEAWHNFYPRPETGLDREEFSIRNKWLTEYGIRVMAFVPGDQSFRGPLYKGLPTLEDHRGASAFASFIDLNYREGVGKILVGDLEISESSLRQFKAFQDGYFLLRARPLLDRQELLNLCAMVHTNRPDAARDCIRSMESRLNGLAEGLSLVPVSVVERKKGSITIDNQLYGRYQGEIQITKTDLCADEKVNVIGHIIEEDLPLLSFIKGGRAFKVEWV